MSVDYRPDYDPADVNSDYGHTGGDITVPTFTGDTRPFRFWCQKALPLVYDDSLSYYEVLCKMADYMNNFVTDLTTVEDSMTEFGQQFVINQQFLNSMADQLGQNVADLEAYINDRMDDFMAAYTQLQTYVNNYFDNLDVQEEINTKLDEMASDGTLNDLFDPVLETWMQQKTAQIDAAIANQDTIQAAQNARISVLEGRMDTFSGLPSGSTSGNAELLDIRTNFLGETYPTAGDAVRASDMIASGFQSIHATKLEEWDGNDASSVYDSIQIDVSGYKDGHVAVIGTFKYFLSDLTELGNCSVYGTNTAGAVADSNAANYYPGDNNSVFTSYTQLTTSISGEERLLLQFAIPDAYAYQYLKIGHFEHGAHEGTYTEPLYIVYANSWSKTQVDPTLSIAGAAADAKAAGDAIDQLNERLYDALVTSGTVKTIIDGEWVQNRATITENVLVESVANNFCHSGFLNIGRNATLNVASGYQVFAWDGAYAEFGHTVHTAISTWSTGTVNYTYDSRYPYLMICIMKTDSSAISPSDAYSAVTISYSEESVFATKSYVNDQLGFIESHAPFTNAEVNKYIKEFYYTGNADLSTISKVRICNGLASSYGAKFLTSNDTEVLNLLFLAIPDGVITKTTTLGTSYVVFDNITSLPDTYKDFDVQVTDNVYVSSTMPSIYSYINDRQLEAEENYYRPFTNVELNKFVKELYIKNEQFDLSTVSKVRVYNGFAGLYGINLFNKSTLVLTLTINSTPNGIIDTNDGYAVITNLANLGETYKDFETGVNVCAKQLTCMPSIYAYVNGLNVVTDSASCVPTNGQITYEGDTRKDSNYIVNAISYPDGVIIACRANGTVVKIDYSGETVLLTIPGSGTFDWRCCYIDSNENVYVSPHASNGSLTNMTDRGLYRLANGGNAFVKVISLYNPSSDITSEKESNNDTIWTMCEDDNGNLYAGVYSHTVRANPAIYKSTDGGSTWSYLYNFKTTGDAQNGVHIHTIIWNKWQKALYCIVGEVNTIFRSDDGGTTWENLNVSLTVKGSSMLPIQSGILIGSDGAYNCDIDLLENDNVSHKKVFRGWANTIFAIRQSDVTGMVYAFTKIDSSVNRTSYYPPVEALTDPDVIDEWHTTVGDTVYNAWKTYHDSVVDEYPEDAIRPQHFAILVSRDGGENWEVLRKFASSSQYANGCWTTGYFFNGECLTGRIVNTVSAKPIIISEGKHKYVASGIDLSGEVFIRTNTSDIVEPS